MASPAYRYVNGRLCSSDPVGSDSPVNAPNGDETNIIEGGAFNDLPLYLVNASDLQDSIVLSDAHTAFSNLQQAYKDIPVVETRIRVAKYRIPSGNGEQDQQDQQKLEALKRLITERSTIEGALKQAIQDRILQLGTWAKNHLLQFTDYSLIVIKGPDVIQQTTDSGRRVIANIRDYEKKSTYLAYVGVNPDSIITIPFVVEWNGKYCALNGWVNTPSPPNWWEYPAVLGPPPLYSTVTELINSVIVKRYGKKYCVGPRIAKESNTDNLETLSKKYKSFLDALVWHTEELKNQEDRKAQKVRDDLVQEEKKAQEAQEALKAQKAQEAQVTLKAQEALKAQNDESIQKAQVSQEAVNSQPTAFRRAWNWVSVRIKMGHIIALFVIAIIVLAVVFSKKPKKHNFISSMCHSMSQYSQPWVF